MYCFLFVVCHDIHCFVGMCMLLIGREYTLSCGSLFSVLVCFSYSCLLPSACPTLVLDKTLNLAGWVGGRVTHLPSRLVFSSKK